jgi:hypothetical protein
MRSGSVLAGRFGGNMRTLAAAIFAASVLSGAALAQNQPPPTDAPATPSPKDVICVEQNPAASTRVHPQRLCRTREEWEKRGGVPK